MLTHLPQDRLRPLHFIRPHRGEPLRHGGSEVLRPGRLIPFPTPSHPPLIKDMRSARGGGTSRLATCWGASQQVEGRKGE